MGAGGVTSPEGRRLVWGAVPVPEEGAGAYDIAFLDLVGEPAQLGLLRRRGLITAGTVTVVAFADHRVASEAELRRGCGVLRVRAARGTEAVARGRWGE